MTSPQEIGEFPPGAIQVVTTSHLLERFIKSSMSSEAPGVVGAVPSLAVAAELAERQGPPSLVVLDYYLDHLSAEDVLPDLVALEVFAGVPIMLVYPPSVELSALALQRRYEDRVETLGKPFTTLGFFLKARRFLAGGPASHLGEELAREIEDAPAPAASMTLELPEGAGQLAPAADGAEHIPREPQPSPDFPTVSSAEPEPPATIPTSMSSPPSLTRFEIISAIPEISDLFQWRSFGEITRATGDSLQEVSDSLAFALQLAVRIGADCGLGDVLELQVAGPLHQAGLFNLDGRGSSDPGLATFGFTAKPGLPVDEIIRRIRRDCEMTP